MRSVGASPWVRARSVLDVYRVFSYKAINGSKKSKCRPARTQPTAEIIPVAEAGVMGLAE